MKKINFGGRRRKSRSSQKRRPINVLASALTSAGLYCGIASIFAAIDNDFEKAAYFILGALIFDMLDGTVAKLTHSTSEFGKQLDSLADLVSFGAAPAVLIYTAYLFEQRALGTVMGRTGAVMAIIFVICAALRLARFNVYQSAMRQYFVGLPTPAAAIVVATFVLFTTYFELQVAYWILGPLTLGLAALMVSNLRYPKDQMKTFILGPRNAFRILALCAVAIAVFHYASEESPSIVLFPLAAAYVIYGLVDNTLLLFTRRLKGESAPQERERRERGEDRGESAKTEELL